MLSGWSRLRSGAEFPWVEQVAKEHGLEWGARQRAAGIARQMAAAGYTTTQARTVVLGMLHGTREHLLAAALEQASHEVAG